MFGIKKQLIWRFILVVVQPCNTVEDLYLLFKMVELAGPFFFNSLQLVLVTISF